MLESHAIADPLFQKFPSSLIPDTEGGLFLFYGEPALFSLLPLLAAWRLEQGERVIFLDGGNCFDPYLLVRLAKELGRDPHDFLASLFVSRAFTCHQMGSLIFNQLRSGIDQHHPRLVILASPLKTFYDESVPFIEARNLLFHLIAALRQLAPDLMFVILSPFPKKAAGRRTFFLSHLKQGADRIFRVNRPEGLLETEVHIVKEKPTSKTWILPILG